MSDVHGDDAMSAEADLPRLSWQPHPWWAWVLGCSVGALAAIGVAGSLLAEAQFGTSLRARACDASALPGLALLGVAALLLVAAHQVSRLRHPEAFAIWDLGSLAWTTPVPLLLAGLTIPGVLGCAVGRDIADLGLVGSGLVGAPGLLMAGAGVALLGAALGGTLQVSWYGQSIPSIDEPPGIVELAMEEAEALQRDGAAQRFHGVDSE